MENKDNKTLILEEFQKLKGQFVITCSHKIERLITVGDDTQDYYWVTYDGRKLTWNTCVGRLMPLKGHLQDKDYNELIRLAKLNHFDQITLWGNENSKEAKEFSNRHKRELTSNLLETETFLTDICWDLI